MLTAATSASLRSTWMCRKPFSRKAFQAAAELVALTPQDLRTELAIGPSGVAFPAHLLGKVEHDRDRQDVMLARQRHEVAARFRLHVRRVDDRQPAAFESFAGDEVQDVEGVAGGALVVLVIGHHRPAGVAGKHLARRRNVLWRKRICPNRWRR